MMRSVSFVSLACGLSFGAFAAIPWFSAKAMPTEIQGGAWNATPSIDGSAWRITADESVFAATQQLAGRTRVEARMTYDVAFLASTLADADVFGGAFPKGALVIGERADGSMAWYGLKGSSSGPAWVELTGAAAMTGVAYRVVQEINFKAKPARVTYSVAAGEGAPTVLADAAGRTRFPLANETPASMGKATFSGPARVTSLVGTQAEHDAPAGRTMFVVSDVSPKDLVRVSLSSLSLGNMTCGASRTARKNRAVEGGQLKMAGQIYTNGVGVHAESSFEYPLAKSCYAFTATVGIDEDAKTNGSVNFQVWADGELVYETGVLTGGVVRTIRVPLGTCDVVRLVVTDGGDGVSYDHADWCDAIFHIKKGMPHGEGATRYLTTQLGILTPPEAETPRINGPRIFGVRPNSPILYKIPVTGVRPMTLSVSGLPAGATFDAATGLIGGAVATAGEYPIAITASNAKGTAHATLKLKVGSRFCLTPPLGWNSWNALGQGVSAAKMCEQADAMVSSGLAEHGWSYMVVDDCWRTRPTSNDVGFAQSSWVGNYAYMLGVERTTDADGDNVPNTNSNFPDMKAMAAYIHGKGLKAGLYSVPSKVGCCYTWGSYGYEKEDAAAWAKWGYDLLKYDWCYADNEYKTGTHEERQIVAYRKMGDLLTAQNRDIVYNVCNYGNYNVTNWAASVGAHYWRMNDDVKANWPDILRGIRSNFLAADTAGAGKGWADPDMLVIGASRLNGFTSCTMSANEQYTHVSIWAMLAAPLFIGCDLTKLDDFTKSLLTNDEVIDINQDELGAVARPVVQTDAYDIWVKPLADGSFAAALFNRDYHTRTITIDFAAHLGTGGNWKVRDVWRQADLGVSADTFSAEIPGRATLIYRLSH